MCVINKNNPHACKNNKIQTCKTIGDDCLFRDGPKRGLRGITDY
jgi:hypothetical protein